MAALAKTNRLRSRQEPIRLETTLYLPIKRFLEEAGYSVKGEVGGCDILALSDDEPPLVVICELKLTFNLELVLQAVDPGRSSAAGPTQISSATCTSS